MKLRALTPATHVALTLSLLLSGFGASAMDELPMGELPKGSFLGRAGVVEPSSLPLTTPEQAASDARVAQTLTEWGAGRAAAPHTAPAQQTKLVAFKTQLYGESTPAPWFVGLEALFPFMSEDLQNAALKMNLSCPYGHTEEKIKNIAQHGPEGFARWLEDPEALQLQLPFVEKLVTADLDIEGLEYLVDAIADIKNDAVLEKRIGKIKALLTAIQGLTTVTPRQQSWEFIVNLLNIPTAAKFSSVSKALLGALKAKPYGHQIYGHRINETLKEVVSEKESTPAVLLRPAQEAKLLTLANKLYGPRSLSKEKTPWLEFLLYGEKTSEPWFMSLAALLPFMSENLQNAALKMKLSSPHGGDTQSVIAHIAKNGPGMILRPLLKDNYPEDLRDLLPFIERLFTGDLNSEQLGHLLYNLNRLEKDLVEPRVASIEGLLKEIEGLTTVRPGQQNAELILDLLTISTAEKFSSVSKALLGALDSPSVGYEIKHKLKKTLSSMPRS